MGAACEDLPDRCCQERCHTTFAQVRRPKRVVEEARKRARKEECSRPFWCCVVASDGVQDEKEFSSKTLRLKSH